MLARGMDPYFISLSHDQLVALAGVAEKHPHSVTIRNEDQPFLLLDLHDHEGATLRTFQMPYDAATLVPLP